MTRLTLLTAATVIGIGFAAQSASAAPPSVIVYPTVRPYSPSLHVLELAAKGTIRNKEVYNRVHYQLLTEVHMEQFAEMIDLWVLEFAELYAARR